MIKIAKQNKFLDRSSFQDCNSIYNFFSIIFPLSFTSKRMNVIDYFSASLAHHPPARKSSAQSSCDIFRLPHAFARTFRPASYLNTLKQHEGNLRQSSGEGCRCGLMAGGDEKSEKRVQSLLISRLGNLITSNRLALIRNHPATLEP